MTLQDLLTASPPRTDFFTAVWLLERMSRDRPRVGEDGPYEAEPLMFRHDPSFSFRPNDISDIRRVQPPVAPEARLQGRKERFEITTCVLGLSGADTPMPLYHAEDLVLGTDGARLQRMFLDQFHNRLAALFFRGRSKYVYPQEFVSGARDILSTRALAMAGVDTYGQTDGDGLSSCELLRLSALLALGGSTARSVENGLAELLGPALDGAPLELKQFTGKWITFDPSQRNCLGRQNTGLADTFVLGTRCLHPAHRARVVLGPMSPAQARTFAPGGPQYDRVRRVVASLCGEPLAFDLELLVDEDAYPPFVLGTIGKRRLGRDVAISARRGRGRVKSHVYELDPERL